LFQSEAVEVEESLLRKAGCGLKAHPTVLLLKILNILNKGGIETSGPFPDRMIGRI
jgi:hypothetical protein